LYLPYNKKPETVENSSQLEEKMWFLRRPAQFLADVAILCGAFFSAY
jgi:hypothetical protein